MRSVACRSRCWTCDSVTVVWCKRVLVSWWRGVTALLMMLMKVRDTSQYFVTGCSCSAAQQRSGSWAALARDHEVMHMN